MADKTIWGVHMAAEHDDRPRAGNYVVIGWHEVGDLARIPPNREAFKQAYARTFPDAKPMKVAVSAEVLFRFTVEMKPGDLIVYPSKIDRTINIGEVAGPYRHDPGAAAEHPNNRPVRWLRSLPREDFSQAALYEMGSALTLFEIKNYADEVLAAVRGEAYAPAELDETSAGEVGKQAEESTEDFIIKQLKGAQNAY